MTWTQGDVDALKKAIASGVRTVSYGGEMTVYRSMPEMLDVLRIMETEVRQSRAPARRVRAVRLHGATGY